MISLGQGKGPGIGAGCFTFPVGLKVGLPMGPVPVQ